ncbi:MAG: GNAT family N-acetyltransferase [Myxococcota bacterium]
MEYGIQRRTIYLTPPDSDDLSWMFHQFDIDEVWQMFGMPGPARLRIMRAYRGGNLVVGIMRRTQDTKRVGFVVMFPPTEDFDFWELGYAIPDHRDRDAWTAYNTTDAMAHYMFEHLRVKAMGWRTREDNRAADAIVRRLGYKSFGRWEVDGHMYTFYRLDQEGWAKRRARLDRGENSNPSGLGDTFVTLAEPPFTPKPL